MRPTEITIGEKRGRLTLIKEGTPIPRGQWRIRTILCQCDCGAEVTVRLDVFRSQKVKSCGCLASDRMKALNWRHGKSPRAAKTAEYKTWSGIKSRCTSKGSPYYGTEIAQEWVEDFPAFLRDMGPKPSPEHSVDRIDNSKGYMPGNCRWATDKEQARNRSDNHIVEYNGKPLCVAELAEQSGMSPQVLYQRITNLGMLPYYAASVRVGDLRLRDKRWLLHFAGKTAMEPVGPKPKPERTRCSHGHGPEDGVRRNRRGKLYCPKCVAVAGIKWRLKARDRR